MIELTMVNCVVNANHSRVYREMSKEHLDLKQMVRYTSTHILYTNRIGRYRLRIANLNLWLENSILIDWSK